MKKKKWWLGGGLLAIAILGGAVWFFNNFERVPDKEWTGYQGEARRNAFLAAERE